METGTNIAPRLQTGCAQPYIAVPVEFIPGNWEQLKLIIHELTDWLNQRGIKIAGPLFYRYYACRNLDNLSGIEVGYPVATEVQGCERIISGKIPKGIFATLIHCGRPGIIHAALETMQCWAGQQDIQWKYELQNGAQVWAGSLSFT